jgi:hypothetical protein
MIFVQTNYEIKRDRTQVDIPNDFQNIASSSSQGISLLEEFVTIQRVPFQQPSVLFQKEVVSLNATNQTISIKY